MLNDNRGNHQATNLSLQVHQIFFCWSWFLQENFTSKTNVLSAFAQAVGAVQALTWRAALFPLEDVELRIARFARHDCGNYQFSKLNKFSDKNNKNVQRKIDAEWTTTWARMIKSNVRIRKLRRELSIQSILRSRALCTILITSDSLRYFLLNLIGQANVQT